MGTDNPLQKVEKEARGLLGHMGTASWYKQLLSTPTTSPPPPSVSSHCQISGTGITRISPSAPANVAASMLDHFNANNRNKSLVELHLERLAQEAADAASGGVRKIKKQKIADASAAAGAAAVGASRRGEDDSKGGSKELKKGSKKGSQKKGAATAAAAAGGGVGVGPAPAPESWVGHHPWRPFDRETDLVIKPKALDPKELLAKTGSLGGMFQSAGGTRHFL